MDRGTGIRIGIQTAFSAPSTKPFEYAIANGFSAFEWFPDKKEDGAGWDADELGAETRSYIKNTARTFDIAMSVHSPWQANAMSVHSPWQANPLAPGGIEVILKNVSFASDIGASLLNIHLYTEEGTEAYLDAIIPLIRVTEEAGMRLSVENTPLTGPGDFNALFRLLKESKDVSSAHVGMCLDLGHANLHEATRNDYLKYYDLIEPAVPLIHLHLHENRGDGDSHLPLFTGPSGEDPSGVEEFLRRIVKRGYSGSAILEQWPEPPSLLNQARDRLYHMLHNMEEAQEREPSRKRKEAEPHERAVDFLDAVVRKDREAPNWKDKLAWVRDLLASEPFDPSRENLVYLAVYLRFLGTGKIAFSEDRGHYRPSRHARSARAIEERLKEITTPDNSFIIRKIYPWLPSYDTAFTRQEPLTRIRDIAHGNDISKELKREIKHTLQNKLHRSADPGDLKTSEALLKRISAPGAGYPAPFVKEFRKFHDELKEFFNARSLDERLRGLMKTREGMEAALLRRFLKSKESAEEDPGRLHEALALLTELRETLKQGIDAASGPELQRLRLSDIGLEDYAFVLLSRAINLFEAQSSGGLDWARALGVLTLAVGNLCLNETEQQECPAITNELNAVRERFDPSNIEHLLRLKASLQRCLRLSERYTDRVLSLFPPRVESLGRRLTWRTSPPGTLWSPEPPPASWYRSVSWGSLPKRHRQTAGT
jgi:phosphoglucan,water dikinase